MSRHAFCSGGALRGGGEVCFFAGVPGGTTAAGKFKIAGIRVVNFVAMCDSFMSHHHPSTRSES